MKEKTQNPQTSPSVKQTQSHKLIEVKTFRSAQRFLYDHTDLERVRVIRNAEEIYKLDRTVQLLDQLDQPHTGLRLVHIAGTKGKGSTVAMLSACLQAIGYTVGEFTSPHLVDIRERIRINSNKITQADFTTRVMEIADAEAAITDNADSHFFELLTAAALKQFAEQAVDIAIMETGLGGRLDCTNVIQPDICLITHISLDHTDLLGDTLEKIAAEKAGILKRGVPAISVPQEPEVEAVLRNHAKLVGTEIRFIDDEIQFTTRFEAREGHKPEHMICVTPSVDAIFEHITVPLLGEHQAVNCALALAAADDLRNRLGTVVDDQAIIQGLATTELAGRMEMLCNEPRIIVDGAHNAVSTKALIKAIGTHISYDSLVVIFGCGSDKDLKGMLKALSLGADKIIFTRAKGNPKAVQPDELQHQMQIISGKMTQVADNLSDALDLAKRAVHREDLICLTGSFYLVGEAHKLFANPNDNPFKLPPTTKTNTRTLY